MAPQISTKTLKVEVEEVVRGYAGSIPSWKVTLIGETGKKDHYWFSKKYPHILTKMEKQSGQKRVLHARARWSYWDRRIPMPNILK